MGYPKTTLGVMGELFSSNFNVGEGGHWLVNILAIIIDIYATINYLMSMELKGCVGVGKKILMFVNIEKFAKILST